MDIGDIDIINFDSGMLILLFIGEHSHRVEFMDYISGKSLKSEFKYNI